MSTITSPRPSVTSPTTPSSSRRASVDTVATRSQSNSTSQAPAPQQRRNRAALRDYYGIKVAGVESAALATPPHSEHELKEDVEGEKSELDADGFDADAYVKSLLDKEGLPGVLRVEGRLVNGKCCARPYSANCQRS